MALKKLLLSGNVAILDQMAASATNFLTIAAGAWLLPINEQAKLVYVYAMYMALVMFNVATLFAVAPILYHEVENKKLYRRQLLRLQMVISAAGALVMVIFIKLVGQWLDWVADDFELLGVAAFLGFQQMSDFNRRSGYVFHEINSALLFSLILLLLRIAVLFLFKPDDAGWFFILLLVSCLPGAFRAISLDWNLPKSRFDHKDIREHFRLSLWNIRAFPFKWMAQHSPVLLAGGIIGPGAAAIIGSVRSISTVTNIFLELLDTYVPARLASLLQREGHKGIKKVINVMYMAGAGIWLAGFLVIFFYGKLILQLLLGPVYVDHDDLLMLFWIGNGLLFISRVSAVRYRLVKLTIVEFVGAFTATIVLLVCLPLIYWYGLIGTGYLIVLVRLANAVSRVVYGSFKTKNTHSLKN